MKVINFLNARFIDLPIFNAAKFFSPCNYYEDMDDRESQTRRWIACLCEKFNFGDSYIADSVRCLSEMDEFICIIYKSYPKKDMFGA